MHTYTVNDKALIQQYKCSPNTDKLYQNIIPGMHIITPIIMNIATQ